MKFFDSCQTVKQQTPKHFLCLASRCEQKLCVCGASTMFSSFPTTIHPFLHPRNVIAKESNSFQHQNECRWPRHIGAIPEHL